jgi:hypothetical protein
MNTGTNQRMSISIYTPDHPDTDTSDPGTPNSKLDGMSLTSTAISTPPASPRLRQSTPNRGVSLEDVNGTIPGWPALARRIANKPAFQAFPSFTDLNMKSLLYYQAQLVSLRRKLHEEEYNDFYHGEGAQTRIAEDLDYLIDSEVKPIQLELIEQIRTVLDKYSKLVWELQYKEDDC